MDVLAHIRFLLLIATSSYVTLAIVDAREAQRLWAVYAIVTFILALGNIAHDEMRE